MDTLTLATADGLVAAALAHASSAYGRPICVAVCDEVGDLIAFARGDGAPVRSIAISRGKAYTAARIGLDTTAFLARLRTLEVQTADFCDDALTALPGGAVLKTRAGALVGGIGVSGLAPAEDQAIVDAVAKAFADRTQ